MKVKKRASKLLPSFKQFLLFENSKYVQHQKGNVIFKSFVLK